MLVALVAVVIFLGVYLIQRGIIRKLQSHMTIVDNVIASLFATSVQAAASAEEQAAALSQVSSSVEEIREMSKSTADRSQGVVEVAGNAVVQGDRGIHSVGEVVSIMDNLSKIAAGRSHAA